MLELCGDFQNVSAGKCDLAVGRVEGPRGKRGELEGKRGRDLERVGELPKAPREAEASASAQTTKREEIIRITILKTNSKCKVLEAPLLPEA